MFWNRLYHGLCDLSIVVASNDVDIVKSVYNSVESNVFVPSDQGI